MNEMLSLLQGIISIQANDRTGLRAHIGLMAVVQKVAHHHYPIPYLLCHGENAVGIEQVSPQIDVVFLKHQCAIVGGFTAHANRHLERQAIAA